MAFSLTENEYDKIKTLFSHPFAKFLTQDFEKRIKKSISVLHFAYLWGACREAKIILEKHPKDNDFNLFDLIMKLYTKRIKTHQANFLLLNYFENALRSTLAIQISNLYNLNYDNWFLAPKDDLKTKSNLDFMLKTLKTRTKQLKIEPQNTWEAFDCFYFVDLENIISYHWGELAFIFKDERYYKNQILPSYGTKEHLLTKISQIRRARNELFHNKPTKIKFQKDLEILLLRMGYNLKDAIQIGEISKSIKLQYNYENNAKTKVIKFVLRKFKKAFKYILR